MTDNEIIKALECCQKSTRWVECKDMRCPAAMSQGCHFYLRTDEDYEGVVQDEQLKDALDLINRQRAEIERLNAEVKEKTETIGFLKKQCTDWCDSFCKAKSEAIKEFAERLKEIPIKMGVPLFGLQTKSEIEEYFDGIMLQVRDGIDNLVKEMTEGSDPE